MAVLTLAHQPPNATAMPNRTTSPIRCSHSRQGSALIKQTVTAQSQRGNDVLRFVARTYQSIRILGSPEIGEEGETDSRSEQSSFGQDSPIAGEILPKSFRS
jgi:hypothetical protein